jgi:hypothetical protein
MPRKSCIEMYEEFVKEHEKTREAFRAEVHARNDRWRGEFDERFGKIPEEFDVMRLEQQRGLGGVAAAIQNDRQVTREMLEELRRENGEEPAGA